MNTVKKLQNRKTLGFSGGMVGILATVLVVKLLLGA